jgi:hypothetical protein
MSVDKVIGTLIVLALIALALALMFASWQRRKRRDISIVASRGDGTLGARLIEIACLYVATTPREEPLERLAIPGLRFRAKAFVSLTVAGIGIEPQGETPTFIAIEHVRCVRAADATIDRSAGRSSLTAVDWKAANGMELTSFLRIPSRLDRTRFSDLVNSAVKNPESQTKENAS